jgi:hypothetical protein
MVRAESGVAAGAIYRLGREFGSRTPATRSDDSLASLARLNDKSSLAMSAFGRKADIAQTSENVRF